MEVRPLLTYTEVTLSKREEQHEYRIGCYCEMYHDIISRNYKIVISFRPNMMAFSHLAMVAVDQGFSFGSFNLINANKPVI